MNYIVAGLGNPGEEYKLTRHNTGRMMVEYVAKKCNFEDFSENLKIKALVSKGKVGKHTVTLVEPNNFMNRSGPSVAPLVKGVTSKIPQAKKGVKKLAFPTLIVIHDDLDIPLGKIKISYNRSSGGHRGVESIIKAIKSEEFIRIKVGISPATPSGKLKKPTGPDAVEHHIIGPFKKPELDIIKTTVAKDVASTLELIITDSKEKAMGEFN